MFGNVLFTSEPLILGQPGTDMSTCDVPMKTYGFSYLKKGVIAGWNPHIWSGTAYFAGFDTGLLFPLNLVFLILPFEKAMNLSLALETWLLGAGMFFLCRQRGLHPLAGFLSGAVMMFSGTYFLHIYSGHPNNTAAMAMAPYLYLAASLIADGKMRQGWLLGSAALALQIISCQPQYVYYTCLGVLLFSLLCLFTVRHKVRFLCTLAAMVAGAVALAALQLLPALVYISESLRSSKGISYQFAAMFSFPPENLVTAFSPFFFGNMKDVPYWGRCYMWEMAPFISVTAAALALYGFCSGPRWVRRIALPMALVFFVLALGAHTPLFRFLYEHVPGFKSFRGNSKFIFQTMIFLGLAAGAGLDVILRGPRRLSVLAGVLLGAGVLLIPVVFWIFSQAPGGASTFWARLPEAIWQTGETYLPPESVKTPDFLEKTAYGAANALLITAGTLILIAVLIFALRARPRWLAASLCGLAVVEVFCFARLLNPSFNLPEYFVKTGAKAVQEFLDAHPGDYRVLLLADPNAAMMIGAQNIWGYGSTPLKRYVEFIGFTQGVDPDTADQYVMFRSLHPLYAMLRCKYAFVPSQDGMQVIEGKEQLPRVSLVPEARIVKGRDNVFAAMSEPSFDLKQTVILEEAPNPPPSNSGASPGEAEVVDSGMNFLDIEAEVASPAILLVTDIFTSGWKARPLQGSGQEHYDVMRANYILQAIPLAAGRHRIRLEYSPPGLPAGIAVSLAAGFVWIAVAIWHARSFRGIAREPRPQHA